jgi:hypothetical protein
MYRYDEFDQQLVTQRVEQFGRQVARRLSGELTEDQFKPLRLMNGLYLQLHAYMLRVNVPYGTLSSRQMRQFAHIARKYDRGYGHFTTRPIRFGLADPQHEDGSGTEEEDRGLCGDAQARRDDLSATEEMRV